MLRSIALLAAVTLNTAPLTPATPPLGTVRVPSVKGEALDGHAVNLPQDLTRATVLVVGFSQKATDPTTVWTRAVRTTIAAPPSISFYELPILAGVPSVLRSFVLRSIKKQVPEIARPFVVPVTGDKSEWKRVSGYDAAAPDAAYIILVDREGVVRWHSHEACGPAVLSHLSAEARKLSASVS